MKISSTEVFLKVSTNIGPFKWQIIKLDFSKMNDTYCTGLSFAQQFPNGILNFGSLWRNSSGCIWYNVQSTRKEFEGGTYFERGMGYKWVHTRPKNITFIILKVNLFRKQIFLFSFEPKTQRNYFLISALASKKRSDQKNKGTLYK